MNQDQRKFLLIRIETTYCKQKKKIEEESKKEKPSLNNYLVAAFLDNTIEFNDIEKLKVKMRETVLRYGASDKLVKETDKWGHSLNSGVNKVEIIAEDLFIIPQAYLNALDEYNKWKAELTEKLDALEAQKDTLLMKIQIGSNAVLDKLITQVDNLADLNIINSQFLLS